MILELNVLPLKKAGRAPAASRMNSEPICVAPTGDRCGEGVIWHELHAAVYWVDINRFLIHRFTHATESVRSWLFDEPATALSRTSADNILELALPSGVLLWEPDDNFRDD